MVEIRALAWAQIPLEAAGRGGLAQVAEAAEGCARKSVRGDWTASFEAVGRAKK